MIHIAVDSVAYLSKQWLAEHNVHCFPLSYRYREKEYEEGFPGEFDEFFVAFQQNKDPIQSSQPALGAFMDVFSACTEGDDEIIYIGVSSKVSGTLQTAIMAKQQLENDRIHIVDSRMGAAPQGYLVEKAVACRNAGMTSEAIIAAVRDEIANLDLYFLVDSLEYLKRSGRIPKSIAAVGQFLGIKPLIGLKDGRLDLKGKVRGSKKAMETLLDCVPQSVDWIRVHHVLALEKAKELMELVKTQFPKANVAIAEIGPVIGGHTGPGTLGISFHKTVD